MFGGRKTEGGLPRIPRSVDPRRARVLPVPAEAQTDARMFMLGGDTLRALKVIVDTTGLRPTPGPGHRVRAGLRHRGAEGKLSRDATHADPDVLLDGRGEDWAR